MDASRMLQKIKFVRYNLKADWSKNNILEKFYPDNCLSAKDISHDKNHVYQSIYEFVKEDCLEKIDDRHFSPRYRITILGKCRILCKRFKIRFLSLCILAEAYSLRKYQMANNCKVMYTICDMHNTFDGMYTKKTLINAKNILRSRHFVYSISNDKMKIRDDKIRELEKHDATLEGLHECLAGVPNQINMMALKDPHMLHKITLR